MKNNQHNSGSVLLYSLLIISLITAISITVSIIVINELKLTGAAANATMAFYAAESGIERGLYDIKIERNNPARTLSNALARVQGFSDSSFYNNASYDDISTDSKTSEIKDKLIPQSQYEQIDYYDADDPLDINPPGDNIIVEYIRVMNSGADLSSWAEVSWSAWDSSGELGTSTSAKKVIGPTDLQDEGWPINLDVFDAFDPVGYRLRVRSLFGDLSSVTVEPYDSLGDLITDLPSYLEVRSVGERSKFKQSLTATVPWKLPLFGLYDYVIYSEGDILKDIILSQLSYTSGAIEVESNFIGPGSCTDCSGVGAGDCVFEGWLAEDCSVNAICTIGVGPDDYCSLPIASDYFELPISDIIPASDEYYISLRYKPPPADSVDMEILISDPDKGDLGFVISDTNVLDWTSCTVSENFALSSKSDRTVTFTNKIATALDIDWYQISSFKIFDDCD